MSIRCVAAPQRIPLLRSVNRFDRSQIYRELATAGRDLFLPTLAMALDDLGITLGLLGRSSAAVRNARGAVALHLELALTHAHTHKPLRKLANALSNLGTHLDDLGRHQEAISATRAAIDLFGELACVRPPWIQSREQLSD